MQGERGRVWFWWEREIDKRLRIRFGKVVQYNRSRKSVGDRKFDYQRNLRFKNCIGQREKKEVVGEEGRERKVREGVEEIGQNQVRQVVLEILEIWELIYVCGRRIVDKFSVLYCNGIKGFFFLEFTGGVMINKMKDFFGFWVVYWFVGGIWWMLDIYLIVIGG